MGWILNRAMFARPAALKHWAGGALCVLLLTGCASRHNARAPVEDRAVAVRTASVGNVAPAAAPPASGSTVAAVPADVTKPPLGIENAGKPGYYSVKPGDTLIRVGLETGQNWKDLLKWNNLDNANLIEVGQVLRVVAPGVDPAAVIARPVASSRVEVRPLEVARPPSPTIPQVNTPTAPPNAVLSPAPATPPAPVPPPPTVVQGDDELSWQWPAPGTVISGFDEAKSKGLGIAGKAGEPVLAAADGKVVYAGSGLRGYGNLVILKHNNTYLSAYAHNQALLVKEDQSVRRGQKIAEMGSTDSDKVQLHFEIRKLGKPMDPTRLLPPR